jgi:hypothetical protein
MAKKSTAKKAAKKSSDDQGMALHGLAKEIGGLSEELGHLYKLENIADNLGEIGSSIGLLAHATLLSIIAKNGTPEEKAEAVQKAKAWLEPV